MREAGRPGRYLVEGQRFVGAAGVSDADGDAPGPVRVAVDALMRNVEVLAVTIEQIPERRRRRALRADEEDDVRARPRVQRL